MTALRTAIIALLIMIAGPAVAELRLVMVEQPGCIWCARWDAEVGDAYALTEEGRRAPLRRIDLRSPVPADLRFARPAVFTPTFVLVADGVELGRIEGYPGEDFFWPLLGRLLAAIPNDKHEDPRP